jgi:hypothetical protein
MPLTSKGRKIMGAMQTQYGSKKGEAVFYASRNKGTITGVDPKSDDAVKSYLDSVTRGDSAAMDQHRARFQKGGG